jgi:hypothetical protein
MESQYRCITQKNVIVDATVSAIEKIEREW